MCAVANNTLIVEENTVKGWSQAGFVSQNSGDADVLCNEAVDNRHALESWGIGGAGTSAVEFEDNLLWAYFEGSAIEVLETDDFAALDCAGNNTFVMSVEVVDSTNGEFIRNLNGSETSSLEVSGNAWWEMERDSENVLQKLTSATDVRNRSEVTAGTSLLTMSTLTEACQSCVCPGGTPQQGGTVRGGPEGAVVRDASAPGGTLGEVPVQTGIRMVGPSPFKSSVSLEFGLGVDAEGIWTATVYDITGRRVKELVRAPAQPGIYRLTWDGRTSTGTRVAAGVYFLRVSAGSHVETRKVVRLH
jgi:hypothetical protein